MRKFHEFADKFPMLSEEKLQELGEDIFVNGLKNPVLFTRINKEKIYIDGRNRCAAMEKVPEASSMYREEYRHCKTEEDVIKLIMSLNVHRRHLNDDQRALIAAESKDIFTRIMAEQKKRKAIGNTNAKQNDDGAERHDPPKGGRKQDNWQNHAAKELNVASRRVEEAAKIINKKDEVAKKKIRDGVATVYTAREEERTRKQKSQQRQIEKQAESAIDKAEKSVVAAKEALDAVKELYQMIKPFLLEIREQTQVSHFEMNRQIIRKQLSNIDESFEAFKDELN